MPCLNRSQERLGGPSLHRKVRSLRTSFLRDPGLGENDPIGVFLVSDIVDDWRDMGNVKHRIADEKAENAKPEFILPEIPRHLRLQEGIRESPVAPQRQNLSPPESSLDGVRVGRGHEVVRHHLRQREGEILGRPDVFSRAEMAEPFLMYSVAVEPSFVHKKRNIVKYR